MDFNNGGKPETPETPETPEIPEIPEMPEISDIPETPEMPGGVEDVTPRRETPGQDTVFRPLGYALPSEGDQSPKYNPPGAGTPKRSKSGLVFGVLIGMTLTLMGVLIASFAMGGTLFARNDTEAPRIWDWGDDPTPTPGAAANTPKPSGGGEATLDIVTPAPFDQAGAGKAAEGGALTYREIYDKGRPSVVCVLVENTKLGYSGLGSGIIMAEEGQYTYIITNCHVVLEYDVIDVLLEDGGEYNAVLVGMDQLSDLAVIKIKATGLRAAEFGESDALQVGDPVMVIGNPVGIELQGTATSGMISAINRDITVSGRAMTMIQTDASVNPGNSGGPMFNEHGQVVGIISSKIMGSITSSVEGLGFAIPIAIAKPVIDDLVSLGYVSGRPTIGLTRVVPITASESRFFNVPRGVRVMEISEKCDAYKQGLRVDDIIFEVNGETVNTVEDVNAIKNRYMVGDSMTVKVYRNPQELEITFKLMEEGQILR